MWPSLEFDTIYFMYILMFFIVVFMVKEKYFKGIINKIWETFKNNKKNVLISLGLMVLIIVFFDKKVAVYFSKNGHTDGILYGIVKIGNSLGNGKYLFSIVVVIGMFFKLLEKEKIVNLFYISIGSGLIASLINPVLKVVFYRQRPYENFNPNLIFAFKRAREEGRFFTDIYDSSYYSMPSGHTITVTSVLVVFALHIKNRYIKTLIFILPLLTGISRIYVNKHWVSDVLTAYVLGILIAVSFYNLNKDKLY